MSRFQVSLQSTCQCLHSVPSFEKFHNINKFDEKIAKVEKGVRLKESKENVYEQKPKVKKIKTSWRVEEWQRMVPIDILFLPTVLWTARKKYVLVRKLAPILKQHLSEYVASQIVDRSWVRSQGHIDQWHIHNPNLKRQKVATSKRFLLKVKLTGKLFLYGMGVWYAVWPPFHQICRTPQCRQVEEKTQNFRSFPTNSSPKGGLIDVGRLLLQFDRVILGLEGRMDSPFSDFGITVTWRRCVGVNWWPGSWAMLLLWAGAPDPPSSAAALSWDYSACATR